MSAHPPGSTTSTPLQFDAAEMGPDGGSAREATACTTCAAPIERYYFEANGAVVCPACRRAAEGAPDGVGGSRAGRIARAMLFGSGAALAGALLYFGVAALTGYEIGLVAIAVGYMVGRAVNAGSRGRGGRRYQALAVGMTYMAIGVAYFSHGMSEMRTARRDRSASGPDSAAVAALAAGAAPQAGDSILTVASAAPVARGTSVREAGSPSAGRRALAVVATVVALVLFVAALPIVAGLSEFPQHAIGLIIVAVALHQAWALNRGVSVAFTGPYRVGDAGTPESAGDGAVADGEAADAR
jgi:hypothetical protein